MACDDHVASGDLSSCSSSGGGGSRSSQCFWGCDCFRGLYACVCFLLFIVCMCVWSSSGIVALAQGKRLLRSEPVLNTLRLVEAGC